MSGWVTNDQRLRFDAEAHAYFLGERRLPSVTQILGDVGVADFTDPHFSDEVKERGQVIHHMIALDVEEQLDDDTVTDDLRPYLDGWRRFLSETRAVVEFWERPICDPELGYAGTLDGVVLLPDEQRGPTRRTVLDVKRALYPSAGPQVAAYARCARSLYDRPVLFNRKALVLPGNGDYRLEPLYDPTDEHTFLAALRIYHWRRTNGLAA